MESILDKTVAIVCNPLAGAGKALIWTKKLTAALLQKGIVYRLYKENWPDNFDSFTDIFIVGGDGTLNYFINRYPGIQLPIVIFNGGTGNDFHWLLYADKSFEVQLQIALKGYSKPIDLGKCNERYFINGVGVGFEGEVVKAISGKKKFSGKTSFFIMILKKIFTYRSKKYSIVSAERRVSGKKFLVDISNGRRAGGGFHIAPEARADDGLLDVIVINALGPFKRLRYLPVIEKGKHLQLSFIDFYRTKRIHIESDQPIQYHVDGEYFEARELAIEILPSAIFFRF